jgi:hypothetical protein
MNNCCICWFFTRIFTGDFNFKGLSARRLYKSFGVKGLTVNIQGSVYVLFFVSRRPIGTCGCCVTWLLTLREECRLKLFESIWAEEGRGNRRVEKTT